MTPENIDAVIQIISGVSIAVASGASGFYLNKIKKPKSAEQKVLRVPRSSCDNHKEVIANVKQIPTIVSGMEYMKERFDNLENDIREVFRVLRDHEGAIGSLKGVKK
jgi:hypothetical protein